LPMIRQVRALMILGVIALLGCVGRESLLIFPATMAVLPSPLNHADGGAFVMREPRDLVAQVKFSSVSRWGLHITARAEPGVGGTWPQLQVQLDKNPTWLVTVESRTATPYQFNFITEPGLSDLKISLRSATPAAKGPTLVVERIEIVPL
jgi:hypothetical protein